MNSSTSPQNYTWAEFKTNQISYEYLEPGIKDSVDPKKIVFRCPIHRHTGHLDGHVQQGR